MRTDVVAGLGWSGEAESLDPRRSAEIVVVPFVDRYGRSMRVMFGRRLRRYTGHDVTAVASAMPAEGFAAATVH